MKRNVIKEKSLQLSKEAIDLYLHMIQRKEYVLSKQLLRSATSIGANVVEASASYSKREFAAKMSISSKEARETYYWLELIDYSKIINYDTIRIKSLCLEVIKLLTSIVKTSQVETKKPFEKSNN